MAIDDELEAVRKTGLRCIGSSPSPCPAEATATLSAILVKRPSIPWGIWPLGRNDNRCFGLAAETWLVF
jgi:hypothetical protein